VIIAPEKTFFILSVPSDNFGAFAALSQKGFQG
jgi:hypothetical protein